MIKERVTIFGRKSWLGGLIAHALGAHQSDADITDRKQIARELKEHGAEVVINVAAKTGGSSADGCDESPHSQAQTYEVNAVGPMRLLDECHRVAPAVRVVQISTTYVFMDTPPVEGGFTEESWPVLPGRKSYPGSKAIADLMLQQYPDTLILRINLPIDGRPHPRNFITKLAGYSKVEDVCHTLTTVPMLVRVMSELIGHGKTGVYHVVHPEPVSNGQVISWYRELVDPAHNTPILPPGGEIRPGIIARPSRLERDCILVGRVEPAIKDCLRQYKQALRTT